MTTKRREGLGHTGKGMVFGTGLPRTGSTSLREALKILGFGPCHHFRSIVEAKFPWTESRLWQQACKATDQEERRRILRQLYEGGGYQSGTDYPTSLFVEDLVEMYPEAKFIHCERSSAQMWRDSVNETIGQAGTAWSWLPVMLVPSYSFNVYPTLMAMNSYAQKTRGASLYGPRTDVQLYGAHNNWVRQVVPKDRLLVFDAKEGFQPMCEFLGVPIPKDENGKDMKYPHVNDRNSMRKDLNRFVMFAWAVALTGAALAVRQWVDVSKYIPW